MRKKLSAMAELFLTFFKIGLFTFGGGYAMLSVIEDACVEKKKWITHDEMMNVTVIAESTPGPIAINCATFVGYKTAGMLGSIAATLGVVMPSFIIIYIISMFLNNLLEYPIVSKAFSGIRAGISLLIVDVGVNMLLKMEKSLQARLIAFGSLAAMLLIDIFAWNFSSIALILIAGAISLALYLIKGAPEKKGGEAK